MPTSVVFLLTARTVNISYANWPIIKQLAWLLGKVMELIFIILSSMDILSITACIVVFTIITRMLLLPLTVKQQRSTRLNALIAPEIQALQKKYAGRKDQASMSRMQMEQQAIYDKYGTSMTAGCLPSLIQFPLLFALYPVIYDMSRYVPQLADYSAEEITKMYTLWGIDLQLAPGWKLSWALLIPILAGLSQFLSSKLMMANTPQQEGQAANTMKYMTWFMPLFSVFICVTLPAFLGVYWVVQAVVMTIQQYFINRKLAKVSVEDMVKENIEKTNKKREKKGLPPINERDTMKSAEKLARLSEKEEKDNSVKEEKISKATEYYNDCAGTSAGSISAKARMVQDYNDRKNKK